MDEKTELKVELLHNEAQERQKKQRFRQIILPIIITAVLLLVVLAVAIVLALKDPTGATGYKAGQITLIIVLFLALLIGLVLIWVLVKAIDGLYRLNHELPKYGKIALGGVVKVEEGARKVADETVEPLLQVQEIGTKVKQVGKSFKDRMSPEG